MIKIEDLKAKDIGTWIKYTGGAGEVEFGRLKGANEVFAFVVFNCDGKWKDFQNYTAESCQADDLSFAEGEDLKLCELAGKVVLCADGDLRFLYKVEKQYLWYGVHVGENDADFRFHRVSKTYRSQVKKDFLDGRVVADAEVVRWT